MRVRLAGDRPNSVPTFRIVSAARRAMPVSGFAISPLSRSISKPWVSGSAAAASASFSVAERHCAKAER
jgi:hypothetical protein